MRMRREGGCCGRRRCRRRRRGRFRVPSKIVLFLAAWILTCRPTEIRADRDVDDGVGGGELSAAADDAASSDRRRQCLTSADARRLLSREDHGGLDDDDRAAADERRPLLLQLGRVRFPGTASTDQRGMFRKTEKKLGGAGRYDHFWTDGVDGAGASVCRSCTGRLCFHSHDDSDESRRSVVVTSGGEVNATVSADAVADAIDDALSLAFAPFEDLKYSVHFDVHVPFDVLEYVRKKEEEETEVGKKKKDNFRRRLVLLTTLREPGSYATKWYRMRSRWDRVAAVSSSAANDGGNGISDNATLEEYVESAPWRMNFLTRVLGSEHDRRAVPTNMLHTSWGEVSGLGGEKVNVPDRATFLEDAYMKEQNELGPELSPVYKLALDRLREDFVHFGLFHRLPESWDLLSHTFCWGEASLGDKRHFPGSNLTGRDAIEAFSAKRKLGIDLDKVWNMLRERNRLDLALMAEAERLMDERLEAMWADRETGILCNFLGKVKVTCEKEEATDPSSSNTKDEL